MMLSPSLGWEPVCLCFCHRTHTVFLPQTTHCIWATDHTLCLSHTPHTVFLPQTTNCASATHHNTQNPRIKVVALKAKISKFYIEKCLMHERFLYNWELIVDLPWKYSAESNARFALLRLLLAKTDWEECDPIEISKKLNSLRLLTVAMVQLLLGKESHQTRWWTNHNQNHIYKRRL